MSKILVCFCISTDGEGAFLAGGSNVTHAPTCHDCASGRNMDGFFKQISGSGIKLQTSLIKRIGNVHLEPGRMDRK